MIAISHDDVADTHCDPDTAGPFDLRTADLDRVAVTDVFLDRRGKPGRNHVEVDWTCAQPPPQAAETAGKNHQQRKDDDGEPPEPALAGNIAPE